MLLRLYSSSTLLSHLLLLIATCSTCNWLLYTSCNCLNKNSWITKAKISEHYPLTFSFRILYKPHLHVYCNHASIIFLQTINPTYSCPSNYFLNAHNQCQCVSSAHCSFGHNWDPHQCQCVQDSCDLTCNSPWVLDENLCSCVCSVVCPNQPPNIECKCSDDPNFG